MLAHRAYRQTRFAIGKRPTQLSIVLARDRSLDPVQLRKSRHDPFNWCSATLSSHRVGRSLPKVHLAHRVGQLAGESFEELSPRHVFGPPQFGRLVQERSCVRRVCAVDQAESRGMAAIPSGQLPWSAAVRGSRRESRRAGRGLRVTRRLWRVACFERNAKGELGALRLLSPEAPVKVPGGSLPLGARKARAAPIPWHHEFRRAVAAPDPVNGKEGSFLRPFCHATQLPPPR